MKIRGNTVGTPIDPDKYAGGVKTVNGIPPDKNGNVEVAGGGAATDEHINSLIDAKLGVIENGTY